MTGEEMVAWKRWHDLGRRKYQRRSAIRWLGLGVLNALITVLFAVFVRDRDPSWVGPLCVAALTGIAVYFFAGHHWDARDEEYRWSATRGGQA